MVAEKITEVRMSGVTRDGSLVPPQPQPFRWYPPLTRKCFGKPRQICSHVTDILSLNGIQRGNHAGNCVYDQVHDQL